METAPATPLAATWAGHRYGLQALKPAIETILIFQKPYEGRPVDDITRTGAGALNVDGGRIGMEKNDIEEMIKKQDSFKGRVNDNIGVRKLKSEDVEKSKRAKDEIVERAITQGRWPANFVLDAEAARRLDEQSGTLTSGVGAVRKNAPGLFGLGGDGKANTEYGDSGGASRFFFQVQEQIDDADPVRYVAKASRRERDAGLENEHEYGHRENGFSDKISSAKLPRRNQHPTIKPLSLTRYLATLLLPPAEYAPRRIFVPFAGVGSECIGAMQAGWDEVVGVELTPEYIPIAEARVKHWQKQARQMELSYGKPA